MPRPLMIAAIAGLLSCALFSSMVLGLPGMLLVYFAQMPILLIGLTMGLGGSAVAASCAAVTIGLLASVAAAAGYLLVQALPALLVVRQALRQRQVGGRVEWFPAGVVLVQLTLLASAAVILAFVLAGGEPGGLPGVIEASFEEALLALGLLAATDPAPAWVGRMATLLPGFTASSALFMVVVNALVAQLVAVRLGRNLRPSPDLARLELPEWFWPGIGIAAVLAVLGGALGALGWSLLVVLVVPYVFLGLAVIHAAARRWPHPGLALGAIYVGIVVLGWPLLLVLLLGLIEDWAALRRRWL